MTLVSSLLIFISLCMQACIARHLPLIHNKELVTIGHFSAKVVNSMQQEEIPNGGNGMNETNHEGDAKIPKTKEDMKHIKGEEINAGWTGHSGSEIDHESASHVGLPKTTRVLEGSELRPSHDSSVKEEVVEMDYEPPHRKSPIHNK